MVSGRPSIPVRAATAIIMAGSAMAGCAADLGSFGNPSWLLPQASRTFVSRQDRQILRRHPLYVRSASAIVGLAALDLDMAPTGSDCGRIVLLMAMARES